MAASETMDFGDRFELCVFFFFFFFFDDDGDGGVLGGSGNSADGGTINSPLLKFDDALYEYLLKNTREPRLLRELREETAAFSQALECKYLPNKEIFYV